MHKDVYNLCCKHKEQAVSLVLLCIFDALAQVVNIKNLFQKSDAKEEV